MGQGQRELSTYQRRGRRMSDSIWKTPDQKPDVFKPHTIMVVYEAHDEAELMLSTQYETYTSDRYINRWCYLDDLIAQADKAERLEKQLNGLKKYSESLWAAWTQAKQDLDFFIKEQVRAQTALIKRTKELDKCQKDLKITRKALKDARIFADTHCIASAVKTIDKALKQIKYKE